MGGSSKSSTSNSSDEYIFNNADYSGDGGGGGGALAKNINLAQSELDIGDITMTDAGAVAGGVDIAKTGIVQTGESFKNLLKTSERLVGDGYAGLKETTNFAETALSKAIGAVSGSQQSVASQLDRVLAYANDSTRADGSSEKERLAKYALIGGGLLVGAYLLKNRG